MPMTLVPGFMLDDDPWRDVGPEWSAFGPATHADLGRDGTLAAMAERALATTPAESMLVGFSLGGYVAREMVRIAPDRVSALVLVATSARGENPAESRREDAFAAIGGQAFGGLSRSAVARSLHPDREGDDALIARIQAMGRRIGADAFRRQSLLGRRDERGLLGDIGCRTLVVAGERDRLRSREEAEELRDGIPGATLEVINGTGHMVRLEAPRRLADTVARWLSEDARSA